MVSVTVEDISVTVEEIAADINGCCTYLRSGERSRCVQAFMGKRSLRIKKRAAVDICCKKRYRREKANFRVAGGLLRGRLSAPKAVRAGLAAW